MSKRFIDYYLDAVTKKSGGGGGSAVVMSDAYLPKKTFDWTVNSPYRGYFASIADLDAWFKSADETTPVYVAGYYPGMQEGDTILVNTRINPTGTEDYFEAYFWGVVKEFVTGSSMSLRMKAFEGYSVPSQGDKLNGATYIAQNGDFEGQTTGATLEVEVPSGGGGGSTLVPLSELISADGTYTFNPFDYSADGFDSVMIDVNTGGGGSSDVVTGTFKVPNNVTTVQNINITPPSGKSAVLVCVWAEGEQYEAVMNASGFRHAPFVYHSKADDSYWSKVSAYKGSASATTLTAQQTRQVQSAASGNTAQLSIGYVNDVLSYKPRASSATGTGYGLCGGVTYNYLVMFE